jgi:membrane fusion protein (multidrug efflux system)/multidrug efflux system membrane fusion protein
VRSIAVLLVLLASACKPPEQPRPAGAHLRKPRVTASEVARRPVEYVVEATGTIEAAEEISIPARVAGILDAVSFKEGDAVTPDTVLAEIEVDRHRLGEERARAELDRARAQATLSDTVYKNRLALYEEGKKQKKEWVTEEQMATWRADLEKAKADLKRSEVDLELARKNHQDARVRAPLAGVVNRKLVSRGEYVKGETVVATMLNVSTLHVRFTVTEVQAARLRPGQDIEFGVRTAPGASFKARLFYMSQKADAATRTVECKAEVTAPSEALRAGTFAAVKAVTGRQESIVVPERAVLPTERGFMILVLEESRVRHRPVRLGLRVPGGVEVTEGLETGVRIVSDGGSGLRDGLEVEIAGPPPPTTPAKGSGR